ncbi:MAG: OmpA family protein [Rhizobiaceae bacterium]|nr:OmpA family protein [Rhizobiaceae bacterium]
MVARRLRIVLSAGILLLPICASAQEVTQQRITNMLGQATKAAPVIDVELLRQEALANPTQNLKSLPNWSKVTNLPQMVVELNFVNNSVAIEPQSYRTIGLLADALHHPNLLKYKFLVVGHTSSTGDPKHNLQLSQDRANAIKEALSTTFAIDPNRLYAVGVGQEYPIDGVDPTAADNRRVQLINLGVFTSKK